MSRTWNGFKKMSHTLLLPKVSQNVNTNGVSNCNFNSQLPSTTVQQYETKVYPIRKKLRFIAPSQADKSKKIALQTEKITMNESENLDNNREILNGDLISEHSATKVQPICDKEKFPRIKTAAARAKAYRLRKKLRLQGIFKQNKCEIDSPQTDKTKQNTTDRLLTNVERIQYEMPIAEHNTLNCKIKTQPSADLNIGNETNFNLIVQLPLAVEQFCNEKKKFAKTNAERQKAYRERKKLKLKSFSKHNGCEENVIKQKSDDSLINQHSTTHVKQILHEMPFCEDNKISIGEIKVETHEDVNASNEEKSCLPENYSAENCFQIDRIKQEITEGNNGTEISFFQEINIPDVEIKQEPNEENLFNYDLIDHFQLMSDQEIKSNYWRPMTNAEKQKAYRERKKLKLNAFSEQNNSEIHEKNQEIPKYVNKECDIFNLNLINQNSTQSYSIKCSTEMTQSDKIKKEIIENQEDEISDLVLLSQKPPKNEIRYEENGIQFVEVNTDVNNESNYHERETNCFENTETEKQKEKLISLTEEPNNVLDSNSSIQPPSESIHKRRSSLKWRSNAERQKAYRQRKKVKLQTLTEKDVYKKFSSQGKEEKERIKRLKQCERQKRCRERKKMQQDIVSYDNCIEH